MMSASVSCEKKGTSSDLVRRQWPEALPIAGGSANPNRFLFPSCSLCEIQD
jgi:hypothetical protein